MPLQISTKQITLTTSNAAIAIAPIIGTIKVQQKAAVTIVTSVVVTRILSACLR